MAKDQDDTPEFVPTAEIKAATNAAGLVPIETLISEAGLGLRKGEVRGFLPSIAQEMVARKHGRIVSAPKEKAAKSE